MNAQKAVLTTLIGGNRSMQRVLRTESTEDKQEYFPVIKGTTQPRVII